MDNRKVLIAISLLVVIASGLYWLLNRGYGEVGDQGYKIATALFSVCSRQDAQRLATVEKLIAQSKDEGSLQPNEAKWLSGIVESAKSGRWEQAASSVRELMDDQIRPASNLPKLD